MTNAERWSVLDGDCRELLAGMPPRTVDAVITDPPYNDWTSENARSDAREGRYIPFDGVDPAWVAPMLERVARRWIVCFCALEQLGDYARAFGPAFMRSGIWHRSRSTPQLSGDRPAQAHEGICIAHSVGRKTYRGRPFAHWAGVGARVQERRDSDHPTPKGIELMVELVLDFSEEGELVLDPFSGSGSTGLACLRLGRRFLGIEKNPKWAEVSRERLRAEQHHSTLQAARSGQMPLFP